MVSAGHTGHINILSICWACSSTLGLLSFAQEELKSNIESMSITQNPLRDCRNILITIKAESLSSIKFVQLGYIISDQGN